MILKRILMLAAAATVSAAACRCFPGDSCWPSASTWQQFNQSVDGRLIATVPLGVPCHDPHFDAGRCDVLRDAWTVPELHYQTSSSIMTPFFANGSCDPFHPVSKPCTLDNYVRFAVNASKPTHFSKTITFAATHNIRLVIRNTGHDYLGKSTGAGGLAVWTHNLKDITITPDYNDAHYTGPAITMGAGVQGFEAYAAADHRGYRVVGGECPSVGVAGGYTQGGGHSFLASRYGLSADQVLAWEVVDGQGHHVTATRDNAYSDLFWALSGGGGGTYAVVWSLTVKLHLDTPVSALNLTFSAANLSTETFSRAISAYQALTPALVDEGAVAVTLMTNTSFSILSLMGPDIPVADLRDLVRPFMDTLTHLGIQYATYSAQFPRYLPAYYQMEIQVAVSTAQYGSWLIPRRVVETPKDNDALTAASLAIAQGGGSVLNVILKVSSDVAGDVDNAVLPAWRDTIFHSVLSTPWVWDDPATVLMWQRKMTEEFVPHLRELAPESGAYMNEADFRQPDFQQVFYGDNYQRLRHIKAKYDPKDVFYAPTAVGSDEWAVQVDGRLCRV